MAKILVPIDGSKHSLRALLYVAKRARHDDKIDLQLLYIQPYAIPTEYVSADVVKRWQEQERKAIFSNPKLKTIVKRLNANVSVKVGDAASEIVAFARKYRCNEIVMGTRGMGRLKGLLMGSIATKIVQLSPVPVTLVK